MLNALATVMMIILLVLSFFFGHEWGAGKLDEYVSRAEKAEKAYYDLIKKQNKDIEKIVEKAKHDEKVIKFSYSEKIDALEEDLKNSQKKIISYDKDVLVLTGKINELNSKIKIVSGDKKGGLEKGKKGLEDKLELVLAKRLAVSCDKNAIFWGGDDE